MAIPDIPPLKVDTARKAIASINAMDLSLVSIDELVCALTPLFRGLRVRTPRFQPGLQLYRGRICETKPSNLRDLKHPPASEVRSLGRLNRIGESLFYCASLREVPFFELESQEGGTIALSHWKTTAPLLVNNVGYTDTVFGGLRSARSAKDAAAFIAENCTEAEKIALDFLSEAFCGRVARGNEDQYKLTIAIGQKLFASDMFGGLIYPTVAMRANGDNLALKPTYAEQSLELTKVEFIRIDAVKNFSYDVTVLDSAIKTTTDGSICWRGRGDAWVLKHKGDALRLCVENGKWVARDLKGNVVNPQ